MAPIQVLVEQVDPYAPIPQQTFVDECKPEKKAEDAESSSNLLLVFLAGAWATAAASLGQQAPHAKTAAVVGMASLVAVGTVMASQAGMELGKNLGISVRETFNKAGFAAAGTLIGFLAGTAWGYEYSNKFALSCLPHETAPAQIVTVPHPAPAPAR